MGRDQVLARLRYEFASASSEVPKRRIAIYGAGGMGKTQVALEYAYRYQKRYKRIFWINGRDQDALFSGYREISEKTRSGPKAAEMKPTKIVHSVLEWLSTQRDWLLVVDNLDNLEIGHGYLPALTEGGNTLITTRDSTCDKIPALGIELGLFDERTAVDMLYHRSDTHTEDISIAVEIVRQLGYIPLAIELAAGYLRPYGSSLSDYSMAYNQSELQLRRGSKVSASVRSAWLLTFERIEE